MGGSPCGFLGGQEAVPVPLTRDRVLGLQHEMRDKLGAEDFQARLLACELSHGKGTLEFRKAHRELVLEAQATVLPKYGFEGSMQGVLKMMEAYKSGFQAEPWRQTKIHGIGLAICKDDAEINANMKEIDALIWKPQRVRTEVRSDLRPKGLQPQTEPRDQRGQRAVDAPSVDRSAFSFKSAPCEIDLDSVSVPFTRERGLALQHDLIHHLGARAFQAQLRLCEDELGRDTPEFRKQHQQLVLEVQRAVLPKYGFEGSLDGVRDMMAALDSFRGDKEVQDKVMLIEKLIWKSGPPHDAWQAALAEHATF